METNNQTEAPKPPKTKPSGRRWLVAGVGFAVGVVVIYRLPLQRWLVAGGHSPAYAESLAGMMQVFDVFMLAMLVMGCLISAGRGAGRGNSYHSNPGSYGTGLGRWRGPL